ncbi:hypothetical protein VQL36_11075 [Chengkuizengella sp. SCS-71B]|uniref:hypothetical protein n=1 Tax=Chengkuizengella sp. SCS-71B TaxID=3115290 RepID=UPI0032C23982
MDRKSKKRCPFIDAYCYTVSETKQTLTSPDNEDPFNPSFTENIVRFTTQPQNCKNIIFPDPENQNTFLLQLSGVYLTKWIITLVSDSPIPVLTYLTTAQNRLFSGSINTRDVMPGNFSQLSGQHLVKVKAPIRIQLRVSSTSNSIVTLPVRNLNNIGCSISASFMIKRIDDF